ncbi:hypothetical protein MMC26_003590 [Xylographa opegraphella]|nr:hypothetical protein [Xylographa opegraphella]
MSSPEKPATTPAYSPAETRLIQIAFKHMKGYPDCNWDAIALEYGYKDGKMARAKYGLAMNKYKTTSATTNGISPTKSATKTSSRKRNAEGTPKGKAGRGRPQKGLTAIEVQEDEDDVEETNKKVKLEPKKEAANSEHSDDEQAIKEELELEEA